MGIACVVLQFKLVLLQLSGHGKHVNVRRNEEVLHPLLFVKLSPIKIPFDVYFNGILPPSCISIYLQDER